MKRDLLLIIFGIIFSISIFAQTNNEYNSSKFIPGCPKEIETIKDQLGLKNLSYANFKTGIDSIKIVFGKMAQGNNNGYWISSYLNNNLTSFSTVSLEKDKFSDFLANNIDIKLDNSSKKISLYVKHNPTTNEILYSWLDGDEKSDKLTVHKIERLLAENKLLPELNLKTLANKNISSADFKGKILVINWWTPTCAPCRQEIPGLNKLVDKFCSNGNVVFLAIAFDNKERVEDYLKVNEFKYVQTLGDNNILKIFGGSFPKNIIVNPDGLVTFYSEGGSEYTYLKIEEELLKLIN
jgi:thiol-disulfide isomerase/thioredoxin